MPHGATARGGSPDAPDTEMRSFDDLPADLRAVFTTYLDHLGVERGMAASTLDSYARDLRRYGAYLRAAGLTSVREVSREHVTAFLMELRAGTNTAPALAPSSAARTLIAVRGLHRFAHREGLTTEDVAREVSPPSPPQRLPKALAVADVLRLLESRGSETVQALRDTALLELLYSTGMRISEAVGLDLDDLDTTERIAIINGKGDRWRRVPVGRPALDAIDSYLVRARPALLGKGRGCPAMFLNARGTRLSRQSGWNALKLAARRAGISDRVSPHVLRHSFATHLMEGGADVRVVQELLGHASITTTQVYTLVTVNTLREVYATSHPRAR